MAARFWRVVGLITRGGGDLALSSLHLYSDSTRVDAGAALTCTATVIDGSLGALSDGDALSIARFAAGDVAAAGFAFVWDFGAAPVNVNLVRLGAVTAEIFVKSLTVESSDDGNVWSGAQTYGDYIYPGDGQMTSGVVTQEDWVLLNFEGSAGDKFTSDSVTPARPIQFFGDAQISLAQSKFGSSSLYLDGTGDYVAVGGIPADLFSGPLTVEFFYLPASYLSFDRALLHINAGSYNGLHVHGDVGRLIVDNGLAATVPSASTVFPSANIFYHVAISLSATTVYAFVNGVLALTHPRQNYGNPTQALIGRFADGTIIGAGYGHICNFLMTIGEAKYTAAFVPPAAAPSVLDRYAALEPPSVFAAPSPAVFAVPGAVVAGAGVIAPQHSGSICDMEYSGRGFIAGTVTRKNTPVNTPLRRRVRLIHERSGLPIRETWSDAITGDYRFDWIDETGTYSVAAWDHLHGYRPEVADNLTLANGGVELLP
jgi:hypothetical protein